MPSSEFEIIERFFSGHLLGREEVALGPGDDCALLRTRPGEWLAVSVDTSVAGVHFPADADPAAIGYRALAVNLSDLAAMGAEPAWFLLALTLPEADEDWLAGFSRGLLELAREHRLPLVGGDITRGPLSVCIQVAGWVPEGKGLRRAGARPGELIYVTGTLGDAAAALDLADGTPSEGVAEDRPDFDFLQARLLRPTPRIAAGLALRGFATACIDISDGLLADLGHVLEASGCGARIDAAALPFSAPLSRLIPDASRRIELAIGGGDDYELCFTVPPGRWTSLEARLRELGCAAACVGEVDAEPGLRVTGPDGAPLPVRHRGFTHFE